jgi:integrase
MPFEQVPAFVAALRTAPSVAKLALEFIILTGLRKNEALGLRWTEVNLEAYLAVIPAVRMKGKRDHALPLTRRAHAILTIQHAATGGKGFVFPGEIAGKQLHDTTLRQHVPEGSTVHGFRSSLRDYLGDMTDTPREVAEAILAHRVGNAVEQAYRRGTALDKRGEALRLWQNFIG